MKMRMGLSVAQKKVKSKWSVYLLEEAVQKKLKVPVTKPQLRAPPRPAPMDVFAPGEIIELDDD